MSNKDIPKPPKKRGFTPPNLDHENTLLETSDEEFEAPEPSPVLFVDVKSKWFGFNLIFFHIFSTDLYWKCIYIVVAVKFDSWESILPLLLLILLPGVNFTLRE